VEIPPQNQLFNLKLLPKKGSPASPEDRCCKYNPDELRSNCIFYFQKHHIQKDSLLPKKAVLHPQKTAAANKILMSCALIVFFIFKNITFKRIHSCLKRQNCIPRRPLLQIKS